MSNRKLVESRKRQDSNGTEAVKAHYTAAAVLLAAAIAFLALAFALNRVFDFSRFAY